MPPVEAVITSSVRRNPRPLADALFPVIGPAIRKAIAHALSGMLDSLNRTLEQSVSMRALQWRVHGLAHGQVVCRGRAAQHAGLPRRAGVPDPLAHRSAAAARRRRRASPRRTPTWCRACSRRSATSRATRSAAAPRTRSTRFRVGELNRPDRAWAPRLPGRRRPRHAAARSAPHAPARHRGDSPAADRRPRAVLRRRLDLRRHAAGVAGVPRVAFSRERQAGLVPQVVDRRRRGRWRCWPVWAGLRYVDQRRFNRYLAVARRATRPGRRQRRASGRTLRGLGPARPAGGRSGVVCRRLGTCARPRRRTLGALPGARPADGRAPRHRACCSRRRGVTLTMRAGHARRQRGGARRRGCARRRCCARTLPGVRQLDPLGHPERGAARGQPAARSGDGAVCPRHARPRAGPGRRARQRWSPNCGSSTRPRARRACAFASSSPGTPMPTARPSGTSR